MTQKMKIAIGAAAFVLFIAGAVVAYNALRGNVSPEIMLAEQPGSISGPQAEAAAESESSSSEQEKLKAPDFTVEDSDGNSVKLTDLAGSPVVINFWASWCPPCKAEMPEFDKVYAELGGEVAFMMVDLTDGQRETKEIGAAYVAERGFSFPVYYDTKQEAAYTYGIRSIPTTLFIDSDGYVVTGAQGQIDEKTLRFGISLILAGEDGTGDSEMTSEYRKISVVEAHEMMSASDEYVLLDVRTDEEFREQQNADCQEVL